MLGVDVLPERRRIVKGRERGEGRRKGRERKRERQRGRERKRKRKRKRWGGWRKHMTEEEEEEEEEEFRCIVMHTLKSPRASPMRRYLSHRLILLHK